MKSIDRNPEQAESATYDLIIVGAGIYGVSLALMASLNGKRALLIEKHDFGAETTFNHLRIVHGGLRYLQKLDLHRFHESVNERSWFFRNFPHMVEPIPCLMPLYGKGLKRPIVFGPALKLNDFLSRKRNEGVLAGKEIPNGKLISKAETVEIYPMVDQDGLKGSAIWFDGSMPDSQIQLIQMLTKACEHGATALNYCEATELDKAEGMVRGIRVKDLESGKSHLYKSPNVVNTAGPWCRSFAGSQDKDYPELFHRSKAWNVYFNRPPLSSHALAVTPKIPNAQTYFLRPFKGKFMAGTIHEACSPHQTDPYPDEESIECFLKNLNTAIPDINLTRKDIIRIYAGFLPAKQEGSKEIAVREVLIDHSRFNGPKGLYSVSGVKFTTARLVGEKALKLVFPEFNDSTVQKEIPGKKHSLVPEMVISSYDLPYDELNTELKEKFLKIIKSESSIHIDDVLFRRTSLGDNPARAKEAAEVLLPSMVSEEKIPGELQRIEHHFRAKQSVNHPNKPTLK